MPSPRSTAQGSDVGVPKVSSGSPANRQPSRPTAMPSAIGPTQIRPVETADAAQALIDFDPEYPAGERSGDAVRRMGRGGHEGVERPEQPGAAYRSERERDDVERAERRSDPLRRLAKPPAIKESAEQAEPTPRRADRTADAGRDGSGWALVHWGRRVAMQEGGRIGASISSPFGLILAKARIQFLVPNREGTDPSLRWDRSHPDLIRFSPNEAFSPEATVRIRTFIP